ncbi:MULTISPECIES: ABC transporter ATP-binding protein [Stappiaceae]|uniref:Trehalose import ATP-binding protein SugC n=1 Tax=Roseibium aggregatum TaxID=187304 RepID=A0A0M6Y3E7_9HYPH|nr:MULTISPECIES: ABC transporter ATP-binding protein [Stappiaceae]ERP93165.1 ABC transporter ATP-binding protein [Labrenzia sp. C1B10]ERS06230.1 ABC transporter ATP-binding protein [Labrenzia sp. C1B70]QFT67298.1 Trehalose import ATP-binding protein SugC [Labrenzia sp. THAF35]CTQ44073.1 Trehalose import ATP-binding protein SugC [Roseibium aggregatum]
MTSDPHIPGAKPSGAGKPIVLETVSRAWGETVAVDGLSIDIPAGSFTALLGPSGCGKSTTLRMIAGLENVSSGRILIGGEDVTGRPSAKRDLAMVFQSYALFPHLNVGENIIFGLKVRRVGRAERDRRLARVADLLGLGQLLERKPGQLSGGQQQRVALGRAIIGEKPICLMDEPLSNLDAKLRHEMRVEIRALQQQLGFTMVYVTHDQVEAITMADQVVLLNGGRLEQVASPRDLYEKPATPFAARFIGTPPMNLFPANAFRKLCTAPDFKLGLRPEAMHLEDGGPVNASVRAVEYLGADVLADCEVAGTGFQVRLPASRAFTPGQSVQLGFSPDDLHVFDADTGRRRDDLISEFGALLRS